MDDFLKELIVRSRVRTPEKIYGSFFQETQKAFLLNFLEKNLEHFPKIPKKFLEKTLKRPMEDFLKSF